jgi:uncharacterized membrane protein YeaQ/YmgE (transglycosylase-associated protein family)
MEITIGRVIAWLLVGALAGSLIGPLATGRKEGYGILQNLAIGCAGALLGGLVFALFNIDLGLADLVVTFNDVVAAIAGTVVLLLIFKIMGKKKAKAGAGTGTPS